MAFLWLVLMASYVVTSGLASEADNDFKKMVLEELQTIKTSYIKLEQKFTELESENKQLRQKMSQKSFIRRNTGHIPNQEVAFSSRVHSHLTNLHADQTIVFGEAITNIGNFYNTHTGKFSVPVSGTYVLFANILSERGNSIETELVADGRVVAEIYSGSTKTFYGAGSNLVIVHLKQGSEVWVKVHSHYSTNFSVHCCWSSFSGYLLRESGTTTSGGSATTTASGPLVVVG